MPLRCLLFSSNEELIQPISLVLADLGIEGDYCKNAVDAVEKVTTQLFQIIVTDWGDQPEATFLLKTARDLKAAQRPLTLAIVSDDARPEAIRAGANSVLSKPIRPEQVRDTIKMACDLLRAKQPGARTVPQSVPVKAAAAAASASGSLPVSVVQAPEKIRAGEFLQSPQSSPGGQFDTEDSGPPPPEPPIEELDALSELEPTAAAMETIPQQKPDPQAALAGWASLQARLTTAPPQAAIGQASPPTRAPSRNELIPSGETASRSAFSVPSIETIIPSTKEVQQETESEALFAYMSQEAKEIPELEGPAAPRLGNALLLSIVALVIVALLAIPPIRRSLTGLSRKAIHDAVSWLNPPPAPLPQAMVQHESFGQSDDEYKLPAAQNVPDAATDASQIRVVPVIDPTAKPDKGAAASANQTTTENVSTDQSQNASVQTSAVGATENHFSDSATGGSNAAASAATESGRLVTTAPNTRVQAAPTQIPAPVRVPAPVRSDSIVGNAGIPSSLKSQLASSTPESSGTKPVDAAMSSIEPVKLPETAALELVAQRVDPEYPATAKASGQRGTVVLEVLIGRDGVVQDAKFLQGSLIFARAAIDAVKQWHFKPYSMNGRAVSVQSVITLNFKPS